MDESFSSVDSLRTYTTADKVTPSDRSNKDKKKNGFSEALKEKMEEKLKEDKQQDTLILNEDETSSKDQPEGQQEESPQEPETTDESSTETPPEATETRHIDVTA